MRKEQRARRRRKRKEGKAPISKTAITTGLFGIASLLVFWLLVRLGAADEDGTSRLLAGIGVVALLVSAGAAFVSYRVLKMVEYRTSVRLFGFFFPAAAFVLWLLVYLWGILG